MKTVRRRVQSSIKRASAKARTDWNYLRKVTPRAIRRALESDPDIHPTDAVFWKGARVVMPRRKEIMRSQERIG